MQLWPPVVDPATLSRQVWDAVTAQQIPAVGRAQALYGGLISQCALDLYQGDLMQPRPDQLKIPDPNQQSLAAFVRGHVDDYLVHGNALHLITLRDRATGAMRSTRWFPAEQWSIDPTYPGNPDYYLNGQKVFAKDVVHVRWGHCPGSPWRGWGIVERYLSTLNRAGLEEAAESSALSGGSVPSVAVITPQKNPTQKELDEAAEGWEKRYGGSSRRPGIFPYGTQVIPLSFSPQAQESTLARQMTLVDVANLLNLDSYWLGAPGSSHTYRSPGPMFLTLLRTSLEPVMADLEQVWSLMWTTPDKQLKFDRIQLTRDDFGTSVTTIAAAVKAKLMTPEEGRIYLGLPPDPTIGEFVAGEPEVDEPPKLTVVPGGPGEEETA